MRDEPKTALPPASGVQPDELIALVNDARKKNVSLWSLVDGRGLADDAVADTFARMLGLPRVTLVTVRVEPDALKAVSEKLAVKHFCLPLTIEDRSLVAAMANPLDFAAIQDVQFASGFTVKPVVATRQEIVEGVGQHYAPEDHAREFVAHVSQTEDFQVLRYPSEASRGPDDEGAGAGGGAEITPVVKLCNLMLYDGIKRGASDIHVEPGLNDVTVRMRIDGALRSYTHFPKWLLEPVVSRLKILARLDIADRRRPQDGRIKVVFRGAPMDVRVSTLPTHFGEKVVMRVLGAGRVPALSEVGLSAAHQILVERSLRQAQGTVLVTGPTGSGKTTTLYSMLQHVRSGELNIVTIEDPIEYQLEGVTQVQVNVKAGLTFGGSLRSILRQDPDVILLGEIRDLETAEIAFQAAMTGHLVLSTLHTNGAVATITRLLDLGVDPVSLASSLSVVVAQRLVRRICSNCAAPHTPSDRQLNDLRLTASDSAFRRGSGCAACDNTGFRGRIGLFEVLPITAAIKAVIARRGSEAELRTAASQAGVRTLLEGGADAVRAGDTTPDEVLRVAQLDDDVDATANAQCPMCRAAVDPAFATCPYCTAALKRTCPSCGQELQPDWKACPYCRSPQEIAPATAAEPLALAGRLSLPPVKQPRILVVDDDALIRRAVQTALGRLDDLTPIVEAAADGAEALKAVAREVPDLVVLDLMMPGMSGFDVCARLRQDLRTAFVPVLMLTMNSDEASRTKGFLVGTDDFMAKPFSVPELVVRVRRLLRRTYGM